MELILIGVVPILFLVLGIVIIMVSQVSSFFTFSRYSARQQVDNRLIGGFIQGMKVAQVQLAGRSQELAQLSQRLALNNQELERLNTLKTKFLSMAVHDMRTPLGTIRGYAEVLATQTAGKRAAKSVNGILVASEQVNRLMADLTDLAVIEAGKLRMEKTPFEVAGLFSDLLSTFLPAAEKKGVYLSVMEMTPGIRVTGDRFRLGQVLSNFLANALKFTPSGGKVELKAVASGEGILFSVTDNGPGIHPEERKKIFDKFYQSKYSDPQIGRKGWGLGLSIAQEIVWAHQGEIGVESAGLGRGSKFWFYIPASPVTRSGYSAKAPRHLLMMGCALLVLIASATSPFTSAHAQAPTHGTLPLEDKARYDRFLEEKVETVLLKILGPNRAKVSVDSTLDFTRTERFQVAGGVKKVDVGDKTSGYAWQSVTTEAGAGAVKELLPGIPLTAGEGLPQFYERQYGYPTSFVKKLIVTIILDKSVGPEQADTIQAIVSDLLEIDPNRGDVLSVVRTNFAPAWKTIWYSQDSFSMILRYGMIGFITIITLIVLAVCFIRLTGAMDTMARAQSQQYALDVGMRGEGGGGGALGLPGLPGPGTEEKKSEPEKPGEILIHVLPNQVPTLIEMLRQEDPDNIALVMAYLEPDIRRAFLNKLPLKVEADVLDRMADVRFVEPDIVEKIKEEIERRLEGSVGGMSRVYEIIQSTPPELQRELLKQLETHYPDMAASVRSKILLMEDLIKLNPTEWGLLVGRVRIEDWASALKDASPELKAAVKSYVLPKTWMVLDQIMESVAAAPRKIADAQLSILQEVHRLIADGMVQNPLEREKSKTQVAAEPGGKPA